MTVAAALPTVGFAVRGCLPVTFTIRLGQCCPRRLPVGPVRPFPAPPPGEAGARSPHPRNFRTHSTSPEAQGLYDPANEHDACGVSFIADLNGVASHRTVELAVNALTCLQHRGATNAEPNTGDGAGILLQVPHRLLAGEIPGLPEAGTYATGIGFLPVDAEEKARTKDAIAKIVADEGLTVVGWRVVPTNPASLGHQALDVMPAFEQIVLASPEASPESTSTARPSSSASASNTSCPSTSRA